MASTLSPNFSSCSRLAIIPRKRKDSFCVEYRAFLAIELRLNAVAPVQERQGEYIADAFCTEVEPYLRLVLALEQLPYSLELVLQGENVEMRRAVAVLEAGTVVAREVGFVADAFDQKLNYQIIRSPKQLRPGNQVQVGN